MHLSDLCDPAEGAQQFLPCVGGRQSPPDVLFGRFIQVSSDLLLQVAFEFRLLDPSPHSSEQEPEPVHDASSWMSRNRATILEACCQSASSTASCLWPVFVRE